MPRKDRSTIRKVAEGEKLDWSLASCANRARLIFIIFIARERKNLPKRSFVFETVISLAFNRIETIIYQLGNEYLHLLVTYMPLQ